MFSKLYGKSEINIILSHLDMKVLQALSKLRMGQQEKDAVMINCAPCCQLDKKTTE